MDMESGLGSSVKSGDCKQTGDDVPNGGPAMFLSNKFIQIQEIDVDAATKQGDPEDGPFPIEPFDFESTWNRAAADLKKSNLEEAEYKTVREGILSEHRELSIGPMKFRLSDDEVSGGIFSQTQDPFPFPPPDDLKTKIESALASLKCGEDDANGLLNSCSSSCRESPMHVGNEEEGVLSITTSTEAMVRTAPAASSLSPLNTLSENKNKLVSPSSSPPKVKDRAAYFGCKECNLKFPIYEDNLFRQHLLIQHDEQHGENDISFFERSKIAIKRICKKCCGTVLHNSEVEEHQMKCLPFMSVDSAFDYDEAEEKLLLQIKCGICPEHVNSRYELKSHIKEEHNHLSQIVVLDPEYRCENCLQNFDEPQEMMKHCEVCVMSRSTLNEKAQDKSSTVNQFGATMTDQPRAGLASTFLSEENAEHNVAAIGSVQKLQSPATAPTASAIYLKALAAAPISTTKASASNNDVRKAVESFSTDAGASEVVTSNVVTNFVSEETSQTYEAPASPPLPKIVAVRSLAPPPPSTQRGTNVVSSPIQVLHPVGVIKCGNRSYCIASKNRKGPTVVNLCIVNNPLQRNNTTASVTDATQHPTQKE